MATTTKEGIIRRLASETGEGIAKSTYIVDAIFRALLSELHAGNDIQIQGFGTFKLKRVLEREVLVPSTRDIAKVPEHTNISFKLSGKLRESIKQVMPKP